MALLVVAYPEMEKPDYENIQAFRQKHDELYYKVIDSHFTIVFPVFDWDSQVFLEEVVNQVCGIQSFDFTLRSAVLNKDAFNDYYHTSGLATHRIRWPVWG